MATDRNDSLLAEMLGELRGIGAVLGDIRDRLPVSVPVPAPADGGEPAAAETAADVGLVDIREPAKPMRNRTAKAAEPARTKPTKRAPSKES